MGFFNLRKKEPLIYEYESENKTKLNIHIEDILASLKDIFKDANDLVFREIVIEGEQKIKAFLCQIDGISNRELIEDVVIRPLTKQSKQGDVTVGGLKENIYKYLTESTIATIDMKEVEYLEEAIDLVLSGETALFLEGYNKGIIISSRNWPARSPDEPNGETVVRGSRDGFVETIRFNTALIRRRIRDPGLKVKQMQVGVRSKTDIAVMYIDSIVDKDILKKVEKNLKDINIDAILDSGYIQQFLEQNPYTPFPQILVTERPDVTAASIYEGKIAIIVDNSPAVLVLPITFSAFFQSSEDYYVRSAVSTVVRLIRILAVIMAVFAPAIYVALTSFNPEVIPTKLALSITSSREGVPFPAFIEIMIMEVTLDILREAGIRLPKPIGSTIGVVGGLVIGQAAVSAGIVSPIAVIIIAITALGTFATPHYEIEASFRMVRVILILCSALLGLYGVVLGIIALVMHLTKIESYGVPYFEPIAPFNLKDLKDSMFAIVPWKFMKERPQYINNNNNNKVRQGGGKNDKK